MAINKLSIIATRRLSLGLVAGASALLFSAFNLIGAGISGGNNIFASEVSASITPISLSVLSGLLSLMFTELADHPKVPAKGHPHSKQNYIESAFVYLVVMGLGTLVYGGYVLISAITGFFT